MEAQTVEMGGGFKWLVEAIPGLTVFKVTLPDGTFRMAYADSVKEAVAVVEWKLERESE